jgi:hypothetical protein
MKVGEIRIAFSWWENQVKFRQDLSAAVQQIDTASNKKTALMTAKNSQEYSNTSNDHRPKASL